MGTVNQNNNSMVYQWALNDQCQLCGHPNGPLCSTCRALLPDNPGPHCRCGLPQSWPEQDQGQLCGRCIASPPAFSRAHSHWQYQWPLAPLINRYKHQRQLALEALFREILTGIPLPWPQAELLCPLPAHWQRRWWRGFDQSHRLAQRLATQWQLPLLYPLQRQRATPRQQGLTRTQRQRNLRQAFRCVAPVEGRRILLIDDVLTTGSSADAASRCLLAAGASEVQLWTLARATL